VTMSEVMSRQFWSSAVFEERNYAGKPWAIKGKS